ncbi:aspartyl protease family protein [Flavobacterium litorale]|uniref:Aspartyl protease family protein n=1 Tax=Flavobacterium litorale TaxID=2856519 RepID=A0ABX8V2U6_9FLAO|nr:aspartyl protease family protein [Flavobacterium litorale]QYJ67169.1 aspartyl protease family protein [Flavobacterium litorale]
MNISNQFLKITFLFIAFNFTIVAMAQDVKECKKIVQITAEGINTKSSAVLETKLAPDFSIAGQTGSIAKMVLQQLFGQLNDQVENYKEINQTNTSKGLELGYNFFYKQRGAVETTFVFNKQNQLTDLQLFGMQVKTMSADTEIQRNNDNVIEVPFEMAGNLIAVEVLLNGVQRKFIVDSGSPRVILNTKYIAGQDNEGKTRISSTTSGVNGSINGMDIGKVEELDFAGIKLENQEVITLDISHLEEDLDTEIYGLIGYDLIQDYDVLFDYENKKLVLINPNHFDNYKTTHLPNAKLETVPFSLNQHIPVIEAQIGRKKYTFGIDCGAEANLIHEPLFESLKSNLKNIELDSLIGADNNPVVINTAEVKSMKIGSKNFKRLVTAFSNISHLNQGYGLNLDGLIGYEVLSKQKTLLSFKRGELVFIE